MPPGAEPLSLFRAIGRSPRAWSKFAGGSLLDRGPLPLREREIVIDRTTAISGCGYEWGIHVRLFGERAGLLQRQIDDMALPGIDKALWTEAEIALIETVDRLLEKKRLDGPEYEQLATHYSEEQVLEIIQLIAFYHGVALICGPSILRPNRACPLCLRQEIEHGQPRRRHRFHRPNRDRPGL